MLVLINPILCGPAFLITVQRYQRGEANSKENPLEEHFEGEVLAIVTPLSLEVAPERVMRGSNMGRPAQPGTKWQAIKNIYNSSLCPLRKTRTQTGGLQISAGDQPPQIGLCVFDTPQALRIHGGAPGEM